MKCEHCGFIPNPGDQICMNCGAKLPAINAVVPEVEKVISHEEKKDNKKNIILTILSILFAVAVIFLFIKFVVL